VQRWRTERADIRKAVGALELFLKQIRAHRV
jgi:hypothetical protein